MRSYSPSTTPGEKWLRPNSVHVSDVCGSPVVQYNEEQVTVQSGGELVTRPWGPLIAPHDPERVIKLLDAQGNDTGNTITGAEALLLLQSLYIDAAQARDAAAEAAAG